LSALAARRPFLPPRRLDHATDELDAAEEDRSPSEEVPASASVRSRLVAQGRHDDAPEAPQRAVEHVLVARILERLGSL
jgi:hypothetical protein